MTESQGDSPTLAKTTAEETLHALVSNRDAGLSKTDADARFQKQGRSRSSRSPRRPAIRKPSSTVGGKKTRVVKGALRTVAEAAGLDATAIAALEKRADEEAQKGVRTLAVARADGDGPLRLLGLAFLYDAPRPESRRLIDELRSLGIKVLTTEGLVNILDLVKSGRATYQQGRAQSVLPLRLTRKAVHRCTG